LLSLLSHSSAEGLAMNQTAKYSAFHTAMLLATGLAFALPAQATTVSVPEPNSLTLIGAAAMSAILLARYLKKK
jgi:hypothetical protein